MRELKYYVACSADGFIARSNGSLVFFPSDGEHLADLMKSFPETFPTHLRETLNVRAGNRCFDTVLMGRKTYQLGLDIGVTSPYGISSNICSLARSRVAPTRTSPSLRQIRCSLYGN